MTASEYLRRPEMIQREIALKKDRIDYLRRQADCFSARLKKVMVMSSPDPTRMQSLLAEAADEEKAIFRLEEEMEQALADSTRVISLLPDRDMIRLMELRYLDGMAWEDVFSEMFLSNSYAFELHRKALNFLDGLPEIRDADCE